MDKQDKTKLITDTALVGALNVLAIYLAQKVYPNNLLLQAFVSGSIIHISMKMIE
jgi:hypothetical protein